MAKLMYIVSAHCGKYTGLLVDHGANGGIARENIRIINKSRRQVLNVQGIDNHQIVDIPIVTAGADIPTHCGEVIGIFHLYAYTRNGKSIHSSLQLEAFKNDVYDKSIKVNSGMQRILTADSYVIPLSIKTGLTYLIIQPYTDKEWDTLPHVIMTADTNWILLSLIATLMTMKSGLMPYLTYVMTLH